MKMKQTILALVLFASVLLCGCSTEFTPDSSEYFDAISKAQAIIVLPSDTSEVRETITGEKEIKNFMTALKPERWELQGIPAAARKTGLLRFVQEETRKPWQPGNSTGMYDVCSITVYDVPYIELEIAGTELPFKINRESSDYLKKYF